jgi:hypothetical protein
MRFFLVVVGLEWGPLSLVSTTEELLESKRSGSGPDTEITAVGLHSYICCYKYPIKFMEQSVASSCSPDKTFYGTEHS